MDNWIINWDFGTKLLTSGIAFLGLVLGILNGLILITQWLKDKPNLVPTPVHPDVYQWYYRLPDGEYSGEKTTRYGFLCYVGIANKGLRAVSLVERRLVLSGKYWKKHELISRNIPQPQIEAGFGGVKLLAVLGQKTLVSDGETHIVSGGSLSGMAFYVYEDYRHDNWEPRIKDSTITADFKIQDVFGNVSKCKIKFLEKPYEHLKETLPDFDISTY